MNRLDLFKTLDLSDFTRNLNDYREMVYVWDEKGKLDIVPNISTQQTTFALDTQTRQAIKDNKIIGVIHSHLPGMLPDLSRSDIGVADSYGIDIACYHMESGNIDYFSPYLHHPYPLYADLRKFEDRRYEEYRSDCYRFIENCLSYTGYHLPKVYRRGSMYQYDENFSLGNISIASGWLPIENHDSALLQNGDLLILRFDTESHHFGLFIEGKVLTFGRKGARCFARKYIDKYTTHAYRLLKPLDIFQHKRLTDILNCFEVMR